jgi:hypothetical protein
MGSTVGFHFELPPVDTVDPPTRRGSPASRSSASGARNQLTPVQRANQKLEMAATGAVANASDSVDSVAAVEKIAKPVTEMQKLLLYVALSVI